MSSRQAESALQRVLTRRVIRLFGLGLSLTLILFVCYRLYLERRQLTALEIDGDLFVAGTVSVLVVILGNIGGSIAGWLLLRGSADTITLPWSIGLNGLAQLAKYLPGNLLHLVGRFFVIRQLTDARTSLYFAFAELGLLSLCGFSIGLLYLHYIQPATWSLPVLTLLCLLSLGTGIWVLYRLQLLNVGLSSLLQICLFYVLSFFLYGFAFNLLFSLVFNVTTGSVMQCASLFALAFVVGYVTPGASGGLGVREFVFMVLAGPLYDQTEAIAVVMLFRIFSVAGDLVFALFAFGTRKLCKVKLVPG